MIYFRISLLLGLNGIIGIAATFINKDWHWLVFEIVNSLKGFGIIMAIVLRKRILHMCKTDDPHKSTTTSVTTYTQHQ